MRTLAALLTLCLTAACGSQQSGTITDEDGKETSFTINTDDGTTEIRAAGEDGEEVTVQAGEGEGDALPLGFTAYPGADIVCNSQVSTNDGAGSILYMQTSDSVDKVTDFYRAQAERAGMTIAMESKAANATTLAGEGANGENFLLTATTGDGGTGIQLMVGTKPGG